MGRIFSIRNVIGIILIGLGIACVLILARQTLPDSVDVIVASADLHPGDPITRDKVHSESWMQVDPLSLDNIVLVSQWRDIMNARVAYGQDIPHGHPISKSQIVYDDKLNDAADRLTVLPAEGKVAFPIMLGPDTVGNWIRPGDYVDLIFSVGTPQGNDVQLPAVLPPANPLNNPGATPAPITNPVTAAGQGTTNSVQLPLAVGVMPNVRILRVDRDTKQIYATSPTTGQEVQRTVDGDVKRIYVELDPADLSVVDLVLQAGTVRASSHLKPLENPEAITVGLSWSDFVTWWESRRPDLFPGQKRTTSALPTPSSTATAKK